MWIEWVLIFAMKMHKSTILGPNQRFNSPPPKKFISVKVLVHILFVGKGVLPIDLEPTLLLQKLLLSFLLWLDVDSMGIGIHIENA